MSREISQENTAKKLNIKQKIKNILRDPMKFYGFSFLIFSILTLIFYFTAGPDVLKFGSFIIAAFMAIMCRQQMKTEMRMYHDR